MIQNIRKATAEDLARIAEIVIFNYRLNFYPIFKNDDYYFNELQVPVLIRRYEAVVDTMWVYDDGSVKGMMQTEDHEIKKLFVEPILQGSGIGSALLEYAMQKHNSNTLWALEKNDRAISFYNRHGFRLTDDRKSEEGTIEFLIRMER